MHPRRGLWRWGRASEVGREPFPLRGLGSSGLRPSCPALARRCPGLSGGRHESEFKSSGLFTGKPEGLGEGSALALTPVWVGRSGRGALLMASSPGAGKAALVPGRPGASPGSTPAPGPSSGCSRRGWGRLGLPSLRLYPARSPERHLLPAGSRTSPAGRGFQKHFL